MEHEEGREASIMVEAKVLGQSEAWWREYVTAWPGYDVTDAAWWAVFWAEMLELEAGSK